MHKKKFLAKLVMATVLTGGINFLPAVPIFHAGNLPAVSIAHAEIKTFAAKNTAMTDVESLTNAAKGTAKERAINLAKRKAETFFKTLSPTLRGRLTDEDIFALVTNNFQLVAEPQYRKLFYQAVDDNGNDLGKTGEIYEATVTIQIDTAALDKYRKLGAADREKLIKQAQNSQAAFEEINRDFEDLSQNARRKSPKQLQDDIKKFEDKVSNAEKRRKKNKSARSEKISTPTNQPITENKPAPKENKPAVTENKPAPPVTNQPMQFSQPVYIGHAGRYPFIGQSPYYKGGVFFEGVSYNNGNILKRGEDAKNTEYGTGLARWGDGKDALYCKYECSNWYDNSVVSHFTEQKLSFGGKNQYILSETSWRDISKIETNQGITLYALYFRYKSSTILDIIGYRQDGSWVKYISMDSIATKYFNKEDARMLIYGGKSWADGITESIKCHKDTIIVPYHHTISNKNQESGEFRFKWDEKAQWFGVDKITY